MTQKFETPIADLRTVYDRMEVLMAEADLAPGEGARQAAEFQQLLTREADLHQTIDASDQRLYSYCPALKERRDMFQGNHDLVMHRAQRLVANGWKPMEGSGVIEAKVDQLLTHLHDTTHRLDGSFVFHKALAREQEYVTQLQKLYGYGEGKDLTPENHMDGPAPELVAGQGAVDVEHHAAVDSLSNQELADHRDRRRYEEEDHAAEERLEAGEEATTVQYQHPKNGPVSLERKTPKLKPKFNGPTLRPF